LPAAAILKSKFQKEYRRDRQDSVVKPRGQHAPKINQPGVGIEAGAKQAGEEIYQRKQTEKKRQDASYHRDAIKLPRRFLGKAISDSFNFPLLPRGKPAIHARWIPGKRWSP
jgi:hypothetical protein